MVNELQKIIQLSNFKESKTSINVQQVTLAKKIINTRPSSTKELFLILSAMNLINAAIKTKEFKCEIYYGMLKQHLSKLLVNVLDNEQLKFDAQIYIDRAQNCVYIEIYGLQYSFHNITIYEQLDNFVNSPQNKPAIWKEIPLQKMAAELFIYAISIIDHTS